MTSPIFHLLFCFLFIFLTELSYSIKSNTIDFCPEIEKQSLLTFKDISSWNNGEVNCCNWEGVVCNNSTGHVSELHLHDFNCWGKLNESLSNLKHLAYLDLSGNHFSGETIPSFIGSFSELEYLDLSYSGFGGKIPPHIGNLSNLHALILTTPYSYSNETLGSENLEWLGGLSKLEYLDMGGTNLSRANNWAEAFNSLPSLLELRLTFCYIDHFPLHVNNLSTSLTLISFSHGFSFADSKPFPQWFFQLKSLVSLDLSYNFFSGQIPAFGNATKLQSLDLYENYLNSTIPDSVYSCKHLRSLDLSYNSIQGQISEAIGNLPSLERLHLNNNKLTGNLPVSLGQLSTMIEFNVRDNQLEGIVNEAHFANLSNLVIFSASGNHLTLSVGPNWILPKNISTLELRSWSLGAGSHTPSWLHKRSNINFLDISDAGISGTIPSWFFDIGFLNVSNNNFHGKVPPYINSSNAFCQWYCVDFYGEGNSSNKRSRIRVHQHPLIGYQYRSFQQQFEW